jgi:hypothetical protein
MNDLIATLTAEDPARDVMPTAAEAAQMDEALQRLLAAEAPVEAGVPSAGGSGDAHKARPRSGFVAPRRAWVLAPVALATAALSLGVVALPGGKTPSVITPANAATVLTDLRGKVVGTTAPAGRFAYQKQIAYVSHMRGGGKGERFVAVIPHELEQWIDADGTAIVREAIHEDQAVFSTPQDEAAYRRAGRQAPPWSSEPRRVDDYRLAGRTVQQVAALPTDPAALKAALEAGEVDLLPATAQLIASPVATPELKAALFTVLKGLPGAQLIPEATDPRKRTGVGVQFEDDAWRTLFLFDPDTGALLGTRSDGKQELPDRTISDWWLVVDATRTDAAPTTAR